MNSPIGHRINLLFDQEAPPIALDELRTIEVSVLERSSRFAGLAAAVITLTVIGVTAFIAFKGPTSPSSPPTSPNTSLTSPNVFQPPTRTAGGETYLDLTLLDGSTITLAYPADLDLTSKGVEAQTVGGVGAPNRGVEVKHQSPEGFVASIEVFSGPAELTDTYTGPDGGTVERWEFSDIAYLVFDFEPWTATVWDTKFKVAANAEGWAHNLHGSIESNGYLTLSADLPLELVPAADDPGPDGPDIRVDGESGSLLVFIDDCDRMTRLDEETYGKDVSAFCDEATNTLFFVGGTAEIQQRVHESLRVNPEEEIPTTTTSITTTTTTLAANLPESGPIFGEETGVVFLLDDGLESVIAVDPDRRLAARSIVEGQRPGDEAFSMVRVGDKLVVGWNFIYSVDIRTRQAIAIGEATVFVPAVEPDTVWMIDYPSGYIGGGRPTVWQVNTAGDVVTTPRVLNSDSIVLSGIEGGLALQSNQGIELWNRDTGDITGLSGNGPGFVHDVHGSKIAWCSGSCDSMTISGGIQFDAPPGTVFGSGQFSDDGRYLAMVIRDADDFSSNSILVLDLETGGSTSSSGIGSVDYIAWSPDSNQLFATGHSYGEGRTALWRYKVTTGRFDSVVLPFGGAITPVVIGGVDADAYFGESPGNPDCLSSIGTLTLNPEICTVDF